MVRRRLTGEAEIDLHPTSGAPAYNRNSVRDTVSP
jgi:hypothetical protein